MARIRPSTTAYAAGPAALLYGILATLTFQARPNNLLSTMTVCFLTSIHRVSTHFNFCAGLWMDFLMQDFQSFILGVLKNRAEA